ncbi:MAG: ATP synthase F1 subunit gamma [candidate division NC10 bacterium]|nr:ATP synthase F1 subunit gamma [candidate division NC10 bacterium]
MATLRDIRRRIKSVEGTQKITKAMKMVAAAKLRRAQQRIVEARPYARKMHEVLSSLALRASPEAHPLLARRVGTHKAGGDRKGLVVIAADKGLCGAFNSNILRKAMDFLKATPEAELRVTLIVVGRKARDFFRRRPYLLRSEYAYIFDKLDYTHGARIGRDIVDAYVGGELDEVYLVYNEFKSAGIQRVVVEKLLPIEPLGVEEGLAPIDFIYEPSPQAILDQLLPRHVEVQVYRALLESVAAEHGSRMTAMEAATQNAADMIAALTLVYNKARQEKITKELLDIVGGAEALRKR